MKKFIAASTIVLGLGVFGTAGEVKKGKTKAKQDILAIASSNDQFETLVAAVKAADLVSVLQSDGPFTIFAPTDEAFAKLSDGTVESLPKPENKDELQKILKYHVVAGKVMAADVKSGQVATVAGEKCSIKVADGKVHVDSAKVVTTDIVATNGVIHVIDAVILPK